MKYRVRLDISFPDEASARRLVDLAEELQGAAVSINEGKPNEEISFYDLEMCGHDEGLPCTRLERVEIRSNQ